MSTPASLSFTIPLSRFDLNLLPPHARQIGTDEFKDAVMHHFAAQYAPQGQQALITVDDAQILVLTYAQGGNPLDFVLPMLQGGRIQEAVPFLESLSKTQPASVQVLYNLGIAYSELGQYDEAIIRLKKAVQLEPGHAHAWTGIGVAYQKMGKRDLALNAMRQAVQADPNDGYARRNLGAAMLGEGQTKEAVAHLRVARQALPHDAQTLFELASALEATGGEAPTDEAAELYLVVIEKFPASPLDEMARTARTQLAHKSMRARVAEACDRTW